MSVEYRRNRMGSRIGRILTWSACLAFLWSFSFSVAEETLEYPVDSGTYLGPSDIAVDSSGKTLFITEFDSSRIREVRADGSAPARILELPIRPERLRLFDRDRRIAVIGEETRDSRAACELPLEHNNPHPMGADREKNLRSSPLVMQGRLLVIDAEKMEILQNVPTGYYPVAVDVFSPQTGDSGGKTLAYVANRFGGDVSVLDLDQGREIARYPFGREPIALAVSPDGKKLIVVPHLPEDTSIKSAVSLLVRVYDTETGEVKSFRMQNESMNAKDVVFSPDGRFAFITCIHGHFDHVTNQLYGGWMFENVVEVVDVRSLRSAEVIPLDEYGFAAANPWGIRRSEDSRFLFVAHAGSCEISILNLEKILHSLDSAYPQPSGLLKDLPLKVRVPVGLYGVRQLAVHENRIYCTGYFEDSIGRTDFQFSEPIVQQLGFPIDPDHFEQPHRLREPAVIADRPGLPLRFEEMNSLNPMRGIHFDRFVARLGPAPVLSEIRLGSLLFHDARICFEHWASCVSCHPDGRADGLNWDLLNDGIGNPKNTKSMLLSHETPPAMVSGIRKDAETAVRSGLSSILFADRPESDAKAIDEYLKSLQPVPSPYLIDGKLSESAKRGEKLFHSSRTGCAECHSPPLFTDLQLHDVGTMSHKDSRRKFDTPTLIEVWRTAPYMHDGRYKTIDETIFEGKKHVNTDGKLDRLTPQEKKDLVQYVLSL